MILYIYQPIEISGGSLHLFEGYFTSLTLSTLGLLIHLDTLHQGEFQTGIICTRQVMAYANVAGLF